MSGWQRVGFSLACAIAADLAVFCFYESTQAFAGGFASPKLALGLSLSAVVYILPAWALFLPVVASVRGYTRLKLVLVAFYGALLGPAVLFAIMAGSQPGRTLLQRLRPNIFDVFGVCISTLAAVLYVLGMRRWNFARIQAN